PRMQLLRRANAAGKGGGKAGRAVRKKYGWSFTDFFGEQEEWAEPDFWPRKGRWPPAALEKREATFQRGYAFIRRYPRMARYDLPGDGQIRPMAGELDWCLPYYLESWEARPVARVALALLDRRTPHDVKRLLKRDLRDIVRSDGLLERARPYRLPQSAHPRVSPTIRPAGQAGDKELLSLCRGSQSMSADAVLKVLRRRVPEVHARIDSTRRKNLDEMIKKPMSPHIKAKEILAWCFGLSERYMRKII